MKRSVKITKPKSVKKHSKRKFSKSIPVAKWMAKKKKA